MILLNQRLHYFKAFYWIPIHLEHDVDDAP